MEKLIRLSKREGEIRILTPDGSEATFTKLVPFGNDGDYYVHYKGHVVIGTGNFRSDQKWSVVSGPGRPPRKPSTDDR